MDVVDAVPRMEMDCRRHKVKHTSLLCLSHEAEFRAINPSSRARPQDR